MAQTILIKRGLEANRTLVTPLQGEFIWTTDAHTLFIGDGSTAGGIKVLGALEGVVAQNTADIDTNIADIATNASNIATNTTDIATNATGISGLNTRLTTAEGTISSNTTAIGTNATDIATANTNIATNATDIATNLAATQSNASNIATNASAISTLDGLAVKSVNGILPASGAVVIDTDDISEGASNLFYTDSRADARVQSAIDDTSSSTTTLWSSAFIDSKLTSGATYMGLWQADGVAGAGTPALADGTGDNGDFYIVEIGGDASFDSGVTTTAYSVGDRIIYQVSTGTWERVVSADAVDSVNGQTGVVTLNLDDINDVNVTAPSANQILSWDNANSEWIAVDAGSVTATTFTSLSDVPTDYTGSAGTFVKVNATEDAVEFVQASTYDLSDVSGDAPTSGQILAWDGTSSWVATNNIDTTYTAGTGLDLTGTVFSLNSAISGLTDVDTTGVAAGEFLKYDGTNWVASVDNTTTTFSELTDTPTALDMTASSGYTVQVNALGTALEYVDTSVINGGTF